MLDAPGLLSVFRLLGLSTSALPKSPSASSPLGGCPASCPDTYRLTHDHRHVRNWARLEIVLLNLRRNIFFRLRRNFLCSCLQKRFQRALANVEGRAGDVKRRAG